MLRVMLLAAACTLPLGCARMVVKKDPGPHDKGIRFYRPKPYLFIGPAGAAASSGDGSQKEAPSNARMAPAASPPAAADDDLKRLVGEVGAIDEKLGELLKQKQNNLTLQPVLIRIEYLPDYSEEYSIRVTPGLGQAQLDVKLQNGWNLNAVTANTDQEYDKIIGAVASLVGAIPKAASFTYGQSMPATAESNVPLGYYEAVIARNEMGRKEMMGWRYVGFMPFNACPVKAQVYRNTITCDDHCLYALVFEGGTLKMQPMPIAAGSRPCGVQPSSPGSPDYGAPVFQEGELISPGPVSRKTQRAKESVSMSDRDEDVSQTEGHVK